MKNPLYEKIYGDFAFVPDPDVQDTLLKSRHLFLTHQIAFGFSRDQETGQATLLKHGSPERVEEWIRTARKRFAQPGELRMAEMLRTIVLPSDFPLEEINRCIQNSNYLGYALKKFCPEAME